MMKQLLVLVFVVLSQITNAQERPSSWAQPIEGLPLTNMYRIDVDLYRSEQPDAEAFKALEKYGIKEVLNLRFWHSDGKMAHTTNLILHRVRMNAHDMEDYDIIQALRIIKNRKGPLVFHCQHGSDRTGALAAMYRIIFQNVSKEDAINELINGGYGFHAIFVNIPAYIKKADIAKIREKVFL